MKAVSSDFIPVEPDEYGCVCGCGQAVFKSDLDRLCKLLFGMLPPGMSSEAQLPNIEVWKDGVEFGGRTDEGGGGQRTYTFTIEDEEGEPDPKKSDIIYYRGRFYIIGNVRTRR